MAKEKNLFQDLKDLFSSSVIVHNVKGKLHILDKNKQQIYGQLQNNFLTSYNAYSKVYTTNRMYGYNSQNSLLVNRLMMFRDYELMDSDSIISSALDIYADEVTLRDEFGDELKIITENNDVKEVLENLFHDVLNIGFSAAPLVRQLCKYGDMYWKLDISEKFGIVNAYPISPYEITREEGYDKNNPAAVRFIHEGATGRSVYGDWELIHFRLPSDTNYYPYGKSIVEPSRRSWKQLQLMEDAMMIHRIMRAPEKRIFGVDVGNIEPSSVDAYMNKIIEKNHKTPYVDPQTGDYNLKYNMQNVLEDIYIPQRGGDSATKIETLPGLQYNAIEDVEYLKNKMISGLKVPKAFLGYEEGLAGKATLAAEDLRFARTIERIQRVIIQEFYKIAWIHLYSQGMSDEDMVSFELQMTSPSIIYEQEKINLWTARADLSAKLLDGKIFDKKYVYTKFFNLTEREIKERQEGMIEDAKFELRMGQIAQEGNDPLKTGQTFGTPHDLATNHAKETGDGRLHSIDFGQKNFKQKDLGGRPAENASTYGTDENEFGRDPLGDKNNKLDKSKGISKENLSKKSKNVIREHKIKEVQLVKASLNSKVATVKETGSILDESNIKNI